jgi:hypothetical protein
MRDGHGKNQRGVCVRRFLAATICGVLLAQVHAQADAPKQPPSPSVYALLAAFGDEFTLVTETSRTGTHLSRRTSGAPATSATTH